MTAAAHEAPAGRPSHTVLYALVAAAFAALLVGSLFAYSSEKETAEAKAKAAQVMRLWEQQGLPTPASDRLLVRVLGTDGGAVCETTGKDLAKAFLAQQLSNGAAGPGQRAVIVAKRTLVGARAIVEVYCPDRLPAFDDFVDSLEFDDVVRG